MQQEMQDTDAAIIRADHEIRLVEAKLIEDEPDSPILETQPKVVIDTLPDPGVFVPAVVVEPRPTGFN